jgi:hypothetical protein
MGRAFATLRVWLGMNDPSENRLHPTYGWLLLDPATVRARSGTVAPFVPPPAREQERETYPNGRRLARRRIA